MKKYIILGVISLLFVGSSASAQSVSNEELIKTLEALLAKLTAELQVLLTQKSTAPSIEYKSPQNIDNKSLIYTVMGNKTHLNKNGENINIIGVFPNPISYLATQGTDPIEVKISGSNLMGGIVYMKDQGSQNCDFAGVIKNTGASYVSGIGCAKMIPDSYSSDGTGLVFRVNKYPKNALPDVVVDSSGRNYYSYTFLILKDNSAVKFKVPVE